MLRKTFFIAFISTICLFSVITSNLFIISKKDYADFKRLNTFNKATNSTDITQNREDVQKDLYIVDDNIRKHFKILSKSSVLYLKQNKNNIDFNENLKDLKCYFQDKFFEKNSFSYQHLRYFEAKNGVYKYPSHSFFAKDIHLHFFYMKGSTIPNTLDFQNAYLQGTSKNLTLKLLNKKPIVEADEIDATLYPKRGF
ncbi:MAG: hypothetical protein K1060chlam5_00407 [Candidatus Anoxychlamydiales bacterium]|nr:hypothetical protein [Candidatus Anoxychlamydiales bacterium]